jgi:hypothetical protein
VSGWTRTRDRLDHKHGLASSGFGPNAAWEAEFGRVGQDGAVVDIPLDTGRLPVDSAPIGDLGAPGPPSGNVGLQRRALERCHLNVIHGGHGSRAGRPAHVSSGPPAHTKGHRDGARRASRVHQRDAARATCVRNLGWSLNRAGSRALSGQWVAHRAADGVFNAWTRLCDAATMSAR